MALLTWKSNFNNYDINLKFLCHYKDGFIVEFDSHDMNDKIKETFELVVNDDYSKTIKMDFLELSKYLFDAIPNLFSVEFIGDNTKSEYFKEDVYK